MAISGIGVIESGILVGNTRPNITPFSYHGDTTVYQVPYITQSNFLTKGFKLSATDEKTQMQIVENQLFGISRTHWGYNSFVLFDGVYFDRSNHPQNNLIVTISGVEAYINNVYIGAKSQEYAWSGLSQSGTNYLWLNLVEDNPDNLNARSSRQYRDFETRFTTDGLKPAGTDSVLVGTYTSGVGFNLNPANKLKFVTAKDHEGNNQNPHGLKLFQDHILVSGVTVLRPSEWNYNATSGAPNVSGYHNVTYLNDLTQQMYLTCSGIYGNIISGSLSGTLFYRMHDLEADPANVGYLTVISGMNISGSVFRQNLDLSSGIRIDLLDPTAILGSVSQTALSGNPFKHHHSLLADSGIAVTLNPKYENALLLPYFVGPGSSNRFENNVDLGNFKPTLRIKSNGTNSNVYIRQMMPEYHNQLESISVNHKIDSGAHPIAVAIRDCVGTSLTPRVGSTLGSSGIALVSTISGFAQGGFSQQLPYDLEFSFQIRSGLSAYMGEIIINYRSVRN